MQGGEKKEGKNFIGMEENSLANLYFAAEQRAKDLKIKNTVGNSAELSKLWRLSGGVPGILCIY